MFSFIIVFCIIIYCESNQDTHILLNFWSANYDEVVWENPYVFKPERFLDANGDLINKGKIVTFGLGNLLNYSIRICFIFF